MGNGSHRLFCMTAHFMIVAEQPAGQGVRRWEAFKNAFFNWPPGIAESRPPFAKPAVEAADKSCLRIAQKENHAMTLGNLA